MSLEADIDAVIECFAGGNTIDCDLFLKTIEALKTSDSKWAPVLRVLLAVELAEHKAQHEASGNNEPHWLEVTAKFQSMGDRQKDLNLLEMALDDARHDGWDAIDREYGTTVPGQPGHPQ